LKKEDRTNNPDKWSRGLRRSVAQFGKEDDFAVPNQAHTRRAMTDRYRDRHTPAAPRVGSDEIKERTEQMPLSKNELVDYLIRLQHGKGSLAKSTYKRLMQHPNFKEILEQV